MTHTLILTNTTYPDKKFKEQIESLGFELLHSPALSISYCDTDAYDLSLAKTLIITSKHAEHNIDNYNIPKNIEILCVGESLRYLLKNHGFTNIKHCFENGAELVYHIQGSNVDYTNIIYLRGKDVQHDIKSVCSDFNILFKEYVVYESNYISNFIEEHSCFVNENQQVTICVFSKKGAESLIKSMDSLSLNGRLRRTNILCLSKRVLSSFEQFKWNNASCCTSPTRAGFFKQLCVIKEMESGI